MTDDDKTENTPDRTARRKARPRWILMSIAGALVLVVGGMTWSAVAYSGKSWDGDKIERFVEWKIDGMLDEVDATDEQREQVRAITTAALADMEEFRDFKREGRQALVEALTQETVDREALEALRQNKLAAGRPRQPAPARGTRRRGRGADTCSAPGTRGGTGVPLAAPS